MEITVNHMADQIKEWCKSDSKSFIDFQVPEKKMKTMVAQELSSLFNNASGNRVKENQIVFESSDYIDLLFNPEADQPSNKILAEITCESVENSDFYEEHINQQIEKLTKSNIIAEYKGATKCIISLYFDITTRNFLHENNFIEIFNDLEIGCAIKRLK